MSEAKTHNFKNTKCKEAYVPPPTVLGKQQLILYCVQAELQIRVLYLEF